MYHVYHVANRTVTFHGVARDAARLLVPLFEGWTVPSISQLPSVQRDRVDVVVPVEPVFHGDQSSHSVASPLPNDESRSLRNMVHQLIDVCRANQSHLMGLQEEVATLRSLVNTLAVRPFTPPAHSAAQVNLEVTGPLPEVPPWRVRQTGRPVFAAAKVVLLQFRTVVVCGFVKITAPAQDAMFMHDKPDHRRDITHSQCSPQGSTWPPRVTRTPNVLSNVCRVRSCNERVHPECGTRRCTLHCASPDCSFHSCPNGRGAGTW